MIERRIILHAHPITELQILKAKKDEVGYTSQVRIVNK